MKKVKYLLFPLGVFFLLIIGSRFVKATGEWTEIEINPHRFGHQCLAATNDNIYCIGGRPSPFANFEPPKNEMLNTETGKWVQKTGIEDVDNPWGEGNVPGGGQTIIFATALGDYIFVVDGVYMADYGGHGPNYVYRAYNILTDEWTIPDYAKQPPAEFFLTGALTYDGKAHFVGFTAEGGNRYLTVYEIDNGLEWTKSYQSDTPTPAENVRSSTITTSIGNKLYVFGGAGVQAHANYTRSTFVFNITNHSWTRKTDMPLLRSNGAATPSPDGTKIYYFGGDKSPQIMNNDGTNTVQIYNVASDSWTISSNFMSKRAQADHNSATAAGKVYLILSAESVTEDYKGERPVMNYYIDQNFNEQTPGWGHTHFASLNIIHCFPNYSRCNYHISPGSENTQFPLFTSIHNGRKVAIAEDLINNSLAFMMEGLPEDAQRLLITFPDKSFTISGSLDWDGIFVLPKVLPSPTVEPDSFETLGVTIKLGGNVGLEFSEPVRILIPGEGGKGVGYIEPSSNVFNEITTICKEDDFAQVREQLASGGICKKDEIFDHEHAQDNLIIWTTHLTEFVTYQEEELPETGMGVIYLVSFGIVSLVVGSVIVKKQKLLN